MEAVHCIFCGDVGVRPYHDENGYHAVSCVGCGLVFVTPRPSEAEMKQLYEGQETKVDLPGLIRRVEAATAEAKRALDLIRQHAGSKAGARILELGSGAGYFLREAIRQGYRAKGIDITRQFVEYSQRALGLDVVMGTLNSADVEDASFDIVYHRNVLSHLAYPIEAFTRMRALLSPGGLVVFQTGNVAELPGSRWAGTSDLDLPDHLFHYGESTIRLLLDRTGFDVVAIKRYALVAHDPWIRSLIVRAKSTFGSRRPNRAAEFAPFEPPTTAPISRFFPSLGVSLEQFLSYGIGSIAPSEGRRCTLFVFARARTSSDR